jgi:hypothetical protein
MLGIAEQTGEVGPAKIGVMAKIGVVLCSTNFKTLYNQGEYNKVNAKPILRLERSLGVFSARLRDCGHFEWSEAHAS